MPPTVSILMSCYNRADLVGQSIESALAQDYPDFEFIIIDDGSSDSSWQVIQHYMVQDSRVKGFHHSHRGTAHFADIYNDALAHAKGKYIAVLDSDDTWPVDKLRKQVHAHESLGCALSFGYLRYLRDGKLSDKIYPDPASSNLSESDRETLLLGLLKGDYFVSPVTSMMTRQTLLDAGGFQQVDYLPAWDYPTYVVLANTPEGSAFIPEVLGHWRQHSAAQLTWKDAANLAEGSYRFACEFSRQHSLGPASTPQALLSDRRCNWLAGANYRAAVLAYDTGKYRQTWRHCQRIFELRKWKLFTKSLAMIAYKTMRKLQQNWQSPSELVSKPE
ncbi:MAG: glycosyltransferase family 2 protein [Deinococcota bacterium]